MRTPESDGACPYAAAIHPVGRRAGAERIGRGANVYAAR